VTSRQLKLHWRAQRQLRSVHWSQHGQLSRVQLERGGQADMARHLTRVRMEQAGSAGQRVQASGNLRALLGQVITWIEHHEPSSPVSIVLRQAQNLWGKRYAEIIAAVPLELLAQWDAQLSSDSNP
jgi:uncharacterized protein involved in type VI secretion and phage assembly